MDVHAVGQVGEGDDVDVVGGLVGGWLDGGRLDETGEALAVAVDGVVDPCQTCWMSMPVQPLIQGIRCHSLPSCQHKLLRKSDDMAVASHYSSRIHSLQRGREDLPVTNRHGRARVGKASVDVSDELVLGDRSGDCGIDGEGGQQSAEEGGVGGGGLHDCKEGMGWGEREREGEKGVVW